MKRRSLTVEEKAAAKRATAFWEKAKNNRLVESRERESLSFGWSESALGQYLRGNIPLNLTALIKIALRLNISPSEIYPELIEKTGLSGITFATVGGSTLPISHESSLNELIKCYLNADDRGKENIIWTARRENRIKNEILSLPDALDGLIELPSTNKKNEVSEF